MRHLKKFENFDLGRFSETEEEKKDIFDEINDIDDYDKMETETELDLDEMDEEEIEDKENIDEEEDEENDQDMRTRVWGDEVIEKFNNFNN